jgi:hypothetical protein
MLFSALLKNRRLAVKKMPEAGCDNDSHNKALDRSRLP